MDKEQKAAIVEELARELSDAGAVFAIDYRGISVPQAAELRSGLRDADARFRIVKNRLTKRAVDASGTEALTEHLRGPTALALVSGDAALAAKTISRLGSEWDLLAYKGGLMEGEPLDADSFTAIARLPGREALHGQLVGLAASPITGLARGLGGLIGGLANQLRQISEEGLVSGEPPAEPAEAEQGEADPPAPGREAEEAGGADAEEAGGADDQTSNDDDKED